MNEKLNEIIDNQVFIVGKQVYNLQDNGMDYECIAGTHLFYVDGKCYPLEQVETLDRTYKLIKEKYHE